MNDRSPAEELASAIHQTADLLVERTISNEVRREAIAKVRSLNELLQSGEERTLDVRVEAFVTGMVPAAGAPTVEPGETIRSFAASPYSGNENALRPSVVDYQAIENGVRATVVMGTALEGRPGRAHGGATAAVFDDVMGAVQRVIGRSGYTRSLTIHYYAALPANEAVDFTATYVGDEGGQFTVEATASHDGKTVASGIGVFTEVSIEAFGARRLAT